ncbi:hypothetical protein B5F07_12255 [Lachnoclostridium sp. An169]|nr:hypothetical protein B5F07_12255 [Lachnoclostridium sp. An169]
MNKDKFMVKEFPEEVFSVSAPVWMTRGKKGGAIMQTWAVCGSRCVLAVDSPAPEIPGLREYIEDIFQKPAIMINTHGHIDHIGCNRQFSEVYMSRKDWNLAAGGGIFRSGKTDTAGGLPYKLNDMPEGKRFSLGDRSFTAVSVPGHTAGSMVLYEQETGILFGGDAIARRILYGLSDWTPLEQYKSGLRKIAGLHITKVCSAHDDFPLPGNMAERILENIDKYLPYTEKVWTSPVDGRIFKQIVTEAGEESIDYFSFVIPADRCEEKENESI